LRWAGQPAVDAPAPGLSPLERALAGRWQRGFPLVAAPYAAIASHHGVGESAVLGALAAMSERGALSRVGPVFRPGVLGASTLAAMAVPAERLAEVAAIVSARPEVNHNYEREHRLNLWFVVTASDTVHLAATLADIERRTGLAVLSLPLVQAFHVDLGFALDDAARRAPRDTGSEARALARDGPHERPCDARRDGARDHTGDGVRNHARDDAREEARATPDDRPGAHGWTLDDSRLIAAVQDGLPLTPRPWLAAARVAGCSERQLLARIAAWIADGTVKRFGLVLRHRPLGFDANAMVVWDVPDAEAEAAGAALACAPAVTLCYTRARALPDWPYNLYCMIHGRDRARVRDEVQALARRHGLDGRAQQILFSRTAFKQRGARYRFPASEAAPERTAHD
jgi:DNA-binding Lrp family transcriptional regulator